MATILVYFVPVDRHAAALQIQVLLHYFSKCYLLLSLHFLQGVLPEIPRNLLKMCCTHPCNKGFMKSKASLDMQTEAELFSDNFERNRRDLYFVIEE